MSQKSAITMNIFFYKKDGKGNQHFRFAFYEYKNIRLALILKLKV